MIKGFACGVFDMFHAGHVLMLKECKENCDYLVVAVNSAKNINKKLNPNKLPILYSLEERMLLMKNSRYVDEVISYSSENELLQIISEGNYDIRFLGDDYKGAQITGPGYCEIYYTSRSHGISTTVLKNKLIAMMEKK